MKRLLQCNHFIRIWLFLILAYTPVIGLTNGEGLQPLNEVIDEISERYNVIITYNSKLLSEMAVDFDFLEGEQLESAVNRALEHTNLKYKQLTDKYYVVFRQTKTSKKTINKIRKKFEEIEKLEESENLNIGRINKRQKDVHLMDVMREAEQLVKEKDISGTVTDESGQALIGASILAKGTTVGTVTDVTGTFQMSVPDEVTTLVVSYIGYATQEVDITSASSLNIILSLSESALDEVIVVGYGSQRKINLTGAVATVSQKDIDARPITSLATAMQGTMSGVFINQNSGRAGQDDVLIRIRGIGTLNDANPLILVDGIEAPLNNINPADVESISVLKDAASAAIYGSRAANGVVLVTTKRGSKDQKPTFSYDGYYGVSQATRLPEMVNDPVLFAQLRNEAATNFGQPAEYSDAQLNEIAARADEIGIDWIDELTRIAPIQQHTLGVSGGNEATNYRVSFGILDQEGILIENKYQRINTRLNLDTRVNDQFSFGTSISLARGNRNDGGSNTATGGSNFGIFAIGLPFHPVVDDQGRPALANAGFGFDNTFGNPVTRLRGSQANVIDHDVLANGYLSYEPITGLTLKATAAINYRNSDLEGFASRLSQYDWIDGREVILNPTRIANRSNWQQLNTTIWLTATYEKRFGDHGLSVLAGYNQEESEAKSFAAGRAGHLSNTVRVLNAGLASSSTNAGSATGWGLRSYFGRVNYSFQDKYLLEANVRFDGSSRFATDKWGTFPSFSAGWIVSEEDFFPQSSFIDFLKVRASWGQLGNQNIDNFAFARQLDLSQAYNFGGVVVPGVTQVSLGNQNLTWETATMTNFGVTMNLMQKLDVEIDYFIRDTEDILFEVPISTLSGFSSQIRNTAQVQNKGWEIGANYRERVGEFSFSIGGNVTHVDNVVTEVNPDIPEGEVDRFIFDIEGVQGGRRIIEQGSPMGGIIGLRALGVFQSQAEIDAAADHSGLLSGVGDLRFEDINGDGVINADDRVIIGKDNPTWLYGFNLSAGWKGFDIAAIFQGAADFHSLGTEELNFPFFNGAAVPTRWLNRWTPENPSNEFPKIFNTFGPSVAFHNTFFLYDRSYFRMKNLQIGYTLPAGTIENSFLQSVRIYFNASNLFTITDIPFGDPERPADADRGSEGHPMLKVFSGGVSVKF